MPWQVVPAASAIPFSNDSTKRWLMTTDRRLQRWVGARLAKIRPSKKKAGREAYLSTRAVALGRIESR